jgi:hypothetical protein
MLAERDNTLLHTASGQRLQLMSVEMMDGKRSLGITGTQKALLRSTKGLRFW